MDGAVVLAAVGAAAARVRVEPAGGLLTSLVVGGHELLAWPDVPGRGSFPAGCFPMAPYAGRVGGAVLPSGESLPVALPPHAAHGVTYDVEWGVATVGEDCCRLETALDRRWPFGGTAWQEVRLLPDRLEVELGVRAGAVAMPAWLGLHPWWRRTVAGTPVRLELPADALMFERGPDRLPTGALVDVGTGPWDDCLQLPAAGAAVRLVWPDVLTLAVSSDARYAVVFDELPDAVCVEPQSAPPDAARLGRAPFLAPGTAHTLTSTFAWS